MSCNENEFKTNARSNSIANSKYPTGFDKVVSSGMFSSYLFQGMFIRSSVTKSADCSAIRTKFRKSGPRLLVISKRRYAEAHDLGLW